MRIAALVTIFFLYLLLFAEISVSQRWVMVNYPKESDSPNFWSKVDLVLKKWRIDAKDSQTLTTYVFFSVLSHL